MKQRKIHQRVAFVVPRTPRFSRRPALRKLWRESSAFRRSFFLRPLPSLALLNLAAYLPESFEALYIDENVEPVDGRGRFDIAAITAITAQAPRAYRLAGRFRRRGGRVVLGGMHPSVMTREALRHGDTVITGEGEGPWIEFVEDFLGARPRRLYGSRGRRCRLGRARVPRYDLIRRHPYGTVPVQIGRGCARGCEFCAVGRVHGSRYRHKGVDQVVREIGAILECWPDDPPEVFFTDDPFPAGRGFTTELLREIEPLGLSWTAMAGEEAARRPGLLRLMARAGCRRLLVGFERPGRGGGRGGAPVPSRRHEELVGAVRSEGIEVLGMFIVGSDGDDTGVFRRIGDFVDRAALRDVQVAIETPLPGSKLYGRLRREGRLPLPVEWSECDFFHVLFRPRQMTPRRLLGGQTSLYRRIYGRGRGGASKRGPGKTGKK